MTRFGKSLAVAASLHAVLCLGLVVKSPFRAVSTETTQANIELQIEQLAPTPPIAPAPHEFGGEASPLPETTVGSGAKSLTREPTLAPRAVESASPVVASDSAATADSQPSDAPAGAQLLSSNQSPPDAAGQERNKRTPDTTIDLGLDGRMFMPKLGETQGAQPRAKALAAKLERNLNAALTTNDVERGLARGGVLVAPLNLATRVAGPSSGEATIRVTVNASGEVGELELLRGATADWSNALKSFRAQAKQKRLRVPAGSKGLRVTLNVSARVQRASGTEVQSSVVGVKRPSLLPDGLTLRGGFDVTDASGKTERMVRSHVIAEEVL